MATLQVKGIDDDLYRALGVRASMDQRSVSQEVVSLIRSFLATPARDPAAATRAFLELSASWTDARSPRQIASTLRRARRSKRRFALKANVLA